MRRDISGLLRFDPWIAHRMGQTLDRLDILPETGQMCLI